MARDEIWDELREHSKQIHNERVAKTPIRTEYAINQFKTNNIEYCIKNPSIGHFHCRRQSDDALFQFWASTGKIIGCDCNNARGIHALINILKG